MGADIRSFFPNPSSAKNSSVQAQKASITNEKKSRGKRKLPHDSDDDSDDGGHSQKKVQNAERSAAPGPRTNDNPQMNSISASDYFSSNTQASGAGDRKGETDILSSKRTSPRRTKKSLSNGEATGTSTKPSQMTHDKPGRGEDFSAESARLNKANESQSNQDQASPPEDVPVHSSKAGLQKSQTTKTSKQVSRSKQPVTKQPVTDDNELLDSITSVRAPTPPPISKPSNAFRKSLVNQERAQVQDPISSAEAPDGAENCLSGLTFVFTGQLENLDREVGQDLIKRYGGKITTAPSRKTSFVVLGSDAGPKKLATIQQHGLRTIDEQGLYELIRKRPANGGDTKAAAENEKKRVAEQQKAIMAAVELDKADAAKLSSKSESRPVQSDKHTTIDPSNSQLLSAKYAPVALNMICGNKGQVEKLQAWLRNWPSNMKSRFKKPGKDGSGSFRAICLHGPPGIGKTTAAHLVASLEGYDAIESNASDTRGKKVIEQAMRGVLDATSLLGFLSGDGKPQTGKKRIILIMDEVDGMSAGDRGGVGAMAAVCRKTSVPIILICNDRRIPKLKPLDLVAYDLPFRRPTVDQIRPRLMTICFREKVKIPPNALNALIEGSHCDIRQIINMLSAAKLDEADLDYDGSTRMSRAWEKNIILRPWDIVGKILNPATFAANSTMTLAQKIELYFNDHDFSALMLQENYLNARPSQAKSTEGKAHNLKVLELFDNAANSISDGDLVDRLIHGSQQQWSLMPVHAVFGFVRPASFVAGPSGQMRFTSWLGNNSKKGPVFLYLPSWITPLLIIIPGKLERLLKEIQGHMRLRCAGDKSDIRQYYLPVLWIRLIEDLQRRGKAAIADVIETMDTYFLTKDDWDTINELGLGSMAAELVKIDAQVKSSFTRAYNQQNHPLPFMKANGVSANPNRASNKPDLEEALEASDDALSEADETLPANEEDVDLKKDGYVKLAKPKRKSKVSTEAEPAKDAGQEKNVKGAKKSSGKKAR